MFRTCLGMLGQAHEITTDTTSLYSTVDAQSQRLACDQMQYPDTYCNKVIWHIQTVSFTKLESLLIDTFQESESVSLWVACFLNVSLVFVVFIWNSWSVSFELPLKDGSMRDTGSLGCFLACSGISSTRHQSTSHHKKSYYDNENHHLSCSSEGLSKLWLRHA